VVVYGNGMFLSRQRIKNGGSFMFTCLPAQSASLVVEINSIEVAFYSLGPLSPPPQSNRQDLMISWSDAGQAIKRKASVVSARSLYKRSDKNQKSFEKAMSELDAKKPDSALKILEKLVVDDPSDFVAWTEKGYIHLDATNFSAANDDFSKALEANKTDLRAILGLGLANISLKSFEKAIEVLLRAYETNPDSADANHYLGEAYLQTRKGSLAIVHMRKAIELDPVQKAPLHLKMANLYHAAGGKQLAAAEYKLFLQTVPNHPDRAKMEAYIKENEKPANE